MRRLGFAFVLLMILATSGWANLLTNGGFNIGPDNLEDFTGTSWSPGGEVGREWWASRHGKYGIYFRGWIDSQNGYAYQDVAQTVAAGETNTYTFQIWVRKEANYNGTKAEVKLEWLDAAYAEVQPQTIADWNASIPNDGAWHPVYVTGSSTNTSLAWVRCTVFCEWGVPPGGSQAIMFDDATLYEGPFAGTLPLWNGSFEERDRYDDWRNTQWTRSTDYCGWQNWAAREGRWGLGFPGGDANRHCALAQNAAIVETGTYTFAVWMRRELNFNLTNAGIRIQLYGSNLTTKVNDDISSNLTAAIPSDNTWRECHVTGVVTNEGAYEARVIIDCGWGSGLGGDQLALKVDNAKLYKGAFAATTAPTSLFDYVYYNNPAVALAENEDVPGLGGTKFLEYSYDVSEPCHLHMIAPEGALEGVYARLHFSNVDSPEERFFAGEVYTTTTVGADNNFHGINTGSMTMDVWRVTFSPPSDWTESLWYAPYFTLPGTRDDDGAVWFAARTLSNSLDASMVYTNNWPTAPQHMSSEKPIDRDYFYWAAATRTGWVERWAYFNHTNYNPQAEVIPAYDGTSTFRAVDYLTTTTVFHVLTDHAAANLAPREGLNVEMRTTWFDPEDALWATWDEYHQMTMISNLTLDGGSPFHGLPAPATQHTVDLWRLNWTQPQMNNGTPFTNAIPVYHAVLMKVWFRQVFPESDYLIDEIWLIEETTNTPANGYNANNYTTDPQLYGPASWDDQDWTYTNQWVALGDSDGDGIPDWWEYLYFKGYTNCNPTGDYDGDGEPNGDEWVFDTHPTNGVLFFDNEIPEISGATGAVIYIEMGPPTTNSRLYDVWWRTNLVDKEDWTPYGLNVPGAANGGSITLAVTGNVPHRVYRWGAVVP